MAKRKRAIPQYGTVTLNGIDYYRTRVQNADGKLVALYARTPEELYDKELGALERSTTIHSAGNPRQLQTTVKNGF